MKKMKLNKKGFTLVELLVVLVILVIIMTIAIPSVTSSIEQEYNITVKEIICDGLLTKEQVKDPLNESYSLSGYILYTKSSNSYDWKEIPDNDSYRLKIEDSLTC